MEAVNKANQIIVDQFEKLVKQIQYEMDLEPSHKIKHSHRLKHIKAALKIFRAYPNKITSIDQFRNVPGFGKGILRRLDEILKTGKLSEINLTVNYEKALGYMEDLERLLGIGRDKASDLVFNHNITSIKDLKKAYEDGKIELSEGIVKALKYFDIYKQEIPREEMMQIDNLLQKAIHDIDPEFFGIICGSYRRLKMKSGDIDLLITHPSIVTKKDLIKKKNYLHLLINELIKQKFIVDSITGTDVETRYMGFCRLDDKHPLRKIDIRYMPNESYYSALLYFTGSGNFNQKMRRLW